MKYKGIERPTIDAMIRIGRACEKLDEDIFFLNDEREIGAPDIIRQAERIEPVRAWDEWEANRAEIERLVFAMYQAESDRPQFVTFEADAEDYLRRGPEFYRDEYGHHCLGPSHKGYALHELAGGNDFRRRFIVCKR